MPWVCRENAELEASFPVWAGRFPVPPREGDWLRGLAAAFTPGWRAVDMGAGNGRGPGHFLPSPEKGQGWLPPEVRMT